MATLPIYFDAMEQSLKAAMAFPNHSARAKAFCAWLIMRGVAGIRENGLDDYIDPPRDELLDVACAASDFAYIYKDAMRNMADGARAGIIVANLWALICTDPATASWESAIELSERDTVRRAGKSLPATRTLFRDCLSRFQPVLHLLGARTMRRADLKSRNYGVDRIVDLKFDLSVGYSRSIDLLFFAAEAAQLQNQLRLWDQRRGDGGKLLGGEMFEFDARWAAPPRKPFWPDTGRLKPCRVAVDMRPERKQSGRPRKTLSK